MLKSTIDNNCQGRLYLYKEVYIYKWITRRWYFIFFFQNSIRLLRRIQQLPAELTGHRIMLCALIMNNLLPFDDVCIIWVKRSTSVALIIINITARPFATLFLRSVYTHKCIHLCIYVVCRCETAST